jgi:hypothetical protein
MKYDKIFFLITLIIVLTLFSWFTSCTHVTDVSGLPQVCFQSEVLPIFNSNCSISGCHSGGGESELKFNNYNEIVSTVVPYDPNASRSYQAIIDKWGQGMPPNQPLSKDNRTIIRVWIEQGALDLPCAQTNTEVPGGTAYVARACFTRDIMPVITSKCASTNCHDAVTHKEGINYSTYTAIKNSVLPGQPLSSKLYTVITKQGGEEKMPPAGSPQLTVAEIDSIGKWISYGALNENCGEVCDTINPVTFSGAIWPVIQSTCTGCHSGSAPSGSTLLADYASVAAVASSGMLIKSLKGTGVTKMPQSGSLSPCRIRQFEIWIKNGYPNN